MRKVNWLFRSDRTKPKLSIARIKFAKKSLTFDHVFYAKKYSDIIKPGTDPYKHYIDHGIKEERWPHPYFNPAYYALRYAAELIGVTDIFTYFLQTGFGRGHIPIPHFSPRWYLKHYKDVGKAGVDPYLHFIRHGDIEGRHPGPSFNSTAHLNQLAGRSIFPEAVFKHWLFNEDKNLNYKTEIFRQLLSDAEMIDDQFYYACYGDTRLSGGTATEDFMLSGAEQFRRPNPVTDMRLVDLIVRTDDIKSDKFMFYMQHLYNYDLDHQGNNYALWKKHFYHDFYPNPNLAKSLPQIETTSRVAVIINTTGKSVNKDKDIVESITKSVGCSTKIYVVKPQASVNEFRSPAEGLRTVRFIESEQDFQTAVKDCDFILTVTDSVLLDPLAIHVMIEETRTQSASFIYSDHDHFLNGFFQLPDFKPSFSPSYLRGYDYCGPVLLARRADLTAGTLSTMWKTLKRQTSLDDHHILLSGDYKIGHAPFVLYHVVGEPSTERAGRPLQIEKKYNDDCSVSIIIPMRDKHELTKACIESILTYTTYPRNLIEIIIIDNESVERKSIDFLNRLRATPGTKVVDYKGAFNFSKINNFAADHAKSEILVFLNNDTAVIDGQWLSKLVHYAAMPDIGAVGAKLVYEDDTIQHGGCVVGAAGGYVEHLLVGKHYRDVNDIDRTREMSTLTGACIAIEAKKFEKIGRFQPTLRVAWNDVFLCLSCLEHGYRNIYLSDAILYHFESKSRGFDNTSEKQDIFAREAAFTRMHFRKYFFDDPSYNSNLSLESAGKLALPPRSLKPWLRGSNRPKKVLMLSCVYNIGYGVPVVMERHARRMVEQGWDVHIGGPLGTNEIPFDGCKRAIFASAMEAASYAYQHDIPVIVSHTPPFFRVTDYVGEHVAVICYDYGEPNPKLFDVGTMHYLQNVNRDKVLAFALATKVVAISQAVKSEGKFIETSVVGLGNDHLAVWSDTMTGTRDSLRKNFGWENKKVILNVCRFPKTERYYKGLDKYVEVMSQFEFTFGADASDYVWVLAGAAGDEDVSEMRSLGLEVFANLPNKDLADLYKAVDFYMSFSKWEGYNLGIGQALAMGLPVVASDIEAHREFPIFTSNSAIDVAVWLRQQFDQAEQSFPVRQATVFKWSESADKFEILMSDVFRDLVSKDAGSNPVRP